MMQMNSKGETATFCERGGQARGAVRALLMMHSAKAAHLTGA